MNTLEKVLNKADQLKEVSELVEYTTDILANEFNKFRRFTLLTEFLNVLETATVFTEVTYDEIENMLKEHGVSFELLETENESLKIELATQFN